MRQARNEELAMKAAKTSEQDVKTLMEEYEARVGAAERKVSSILTGISNSRYSRYRNRSPDSRTLKVVMSELSLMTPMYCINEQKLGS